MDIREGRWGTGASAVGGTSRAKRELGFARQFAGWLEERRKFTMIH